MQSKTLHTIQIFAKVGKVIATIVFVFSLIGVVGCAIGLAAYGSLQSVIRVGGVTVHGLLENAANLSTGAMYATMSAGLIMCICEGLVARQAMLYFRHELQCGTPFTFEGASRLLRLGLWVIIVPLAGLIAAQISYGVILHAFADTVSEINVEGGPSVGLGVGLIAASFLCKYGAEVQNTEEAPR